MRAILPNRRAAQTFTFHHKDHEYRVTCGYFPEGHLGEIFLNSTKHNSYLNAMVCDAAIAASLALQHATPLATLRAAMLKESNGQPATALGAAIEEIIRRSMDVMI